MRGTVTNITDDGKPAEEGIWKPSGERQPKKAYEGNSYKRRGDGSLRVYVPKTVIFVTVPRMQCEEMVIAYEKKKAGLHRAAPPFGVVLLFRNVCLYFTMPRRGALARNFQVKNLHIKEKGFIFATARQHPTQLNASNT